LEGSSRDDALLVRGFEGFRAAQRLDDIRAESSSGGNHHWSRFEDGWQGIDLRVLRG
jgi:hypothetical protein